MAELDRRDFIRVSAAGGAALSALGASCVPASGPEARASSNAGDFEIPDFPLEEASITDLRDAIDSGEQSCSSITQAYLERIESLNRQGPRLFAVLEPNPNSSIVRRSSLGCKVIVTFTIPMLLDSSMTSRNERMPCGDTS